jgi:uncharacterized protein (DUF2267 family)
MVATTIHGINETVERTETLLNEMALELDGDKAAAYGALRGVLHALRTWLSVDEGAQLSAQLPLLVRGIFYEGWDPGEQADHRRDPDEFLDRVAAGTRMTRQEAFRACHVTGRALRKHVSVGEWDDVLHTLAEPVRNLLD